MPRNNLETRNHNTPILRCILLILLLVYLLIGCIYLYVGPIRTYSIKKAYLKHTPRIVISLTTTPYRIEKIKPVLKSLQDQSIPASEIYLNIPYVFMRDNTEYVIPSWLQEMKNIKIVRSPDYGPGTKIIPTIQNEINPETMIITVDDDGIYSRHLVRELFYKSLHNPKNILTVSNINFNIENDNRIVDMLVGFKDDSKSLLVVGSSGVLYRRKFFDDDFFELYSSLPLKCRLGDDLMISIYAAKENIDITQAAAGILHPLLRGHVLFPSTKAMPYHRTKDALSMGANGIGDTIENYEACLSYLKNNNTEYFNAFLNKSITNPRPNNLYTQLHRQPTTPYEYEKNEV